MNKYNQKTPKRQKASHPEYSLITVRYADKKASTFITRSTYPGSTGKLELSVKRSPLSSPAWNPQEKSHGYSMENTTFAKNFGHLDFSMESTGLLSETQLKNISSKKEKK